jgi:hypothetical protein
MSARPFSTPTRRCESGQSSGIDQGSRRRHASGKVDLLVILGGNPAYDAPADLDFADVLKNGKTPLRVHLGLYQNETAELCQWHVNQAHELEVLGRRARLRWHGQHYSAADRSSLWRQEQQTNSSLCFPDKPDATGYDLVRALLAEAAHRRRLRAVLAQVSARRLDRGNGITPRKQVKASDAAGRWSPAPDRHPVVQGLIPAGIATPSSSTSAATPPSTTDNSPTTAGCRNCPSR